MNRAYVTDFTHILRQSRPSTMRQLVAHCLAGGGVRAGKQGLTEAGGNAYLSRDFPKLDYIKRTIVIEPN